MVRLRAPASSCEMPSVGVTFTTVKRWRCSVHQRSGRHNTAANTRDHSRGMRWDVIGLSLCLVIQAIACGPGTATPAEETRRFALSRPAGRTRRSFAVSADGRFLAYSAESESDQRLHLYVRPLEGISTDADREIAGSAGAHNPFFAPNGNAIAVFSGGAPLGTGTTAPSSCC